jgi:hypothetical protein
MRNSRKQPFALKRWKKRKQLPTSRLNSLNQKSKSKLPRTTPKRNWLKRIVWRSVTSRSLKVARRPRSEGEAAKTSQVGGAEAAVFLQKIQAYGDPRLFALRDLADRFANSKQPLVPERRFITGGDGKDGQTGLLQTLLGRLVSQRSGVEVAEGAPNQAVPGIGSEGSCQPAEGLEKTTSV